MKKKEQIINQKSPEQPKIICNKVSKRFLNLSESVSLGLEPEPCITDFVIKKELGRGSFGQVFLAMHKKTKVNYAIKSIDKRNKNNQDGKPYFRREIEIMYKIRHPNCVRLFGNFEDETNCYFIMEYIQKGSLFNLILSNKNKGIEKTIVAKAMRELINAIHYLHSMSPPIIHRDIKPENILLTNENKIKLTDFGWANYINFQDEQRNTFCGTPLYLAPEMIENNGHGKYVDIWCLGVLLFELLVGVPPFSGKDRAMLIKNIMKVHILWPKYPKKEIDKDAKDLITKILRIEPKQRISLEDMVKHPFFTKNCPDFPPYLENTIQYHNKPFIISKDIPSEDNDNDNSNFINTKNIKLESNISENKNNLDELNINNNTPGSYIEKNNININNIESHNKDTEIVKNKIIKLKIENNPKDKNKKKLINNKSDTNLFSKMPYKKKLYKNNDQNNDYEQLLKKIEEYEKKDIEKNKKIEELLSKNIYLTKENESLNKKIKEKEGELEEKENIIKILESQLLSKKLSPMNKIFFNKSRNISLNKSQSSEKENNNSFFSKNNKYSSRTPETSPSKFKKRKKILNIQTKPYMKKNIFMNKKFDNDDSDVNKIKESLLQFDGNISSTNISSLDNQEIEKLKKEFNKEKEQHESDINYFIKEIRLLQIENKNIKEKDKKEIIKLTRYLIENEKEIKKWKDKVKELEIKINQNNI